MSRLRLAAGRAGRRGTPRAVSIRAIDPRGIDIRTVEIRAARRLAVIFILLVGGIAPGGPVSADVEGFTFQISPVETTLGQFSTINIASTAFGAGVPLTVTLQGVTVASGRSDRTDAFNPGDVAVPAGAAGCGTDTVDLESIDDTGVTFTAASRTVTVYCPTVHVTPDPIDSGGGPASFTATGTGYPPDRAVSLTIDGDPNPFVTVVTDGNGGFAEPASRPQLACGTHTLTATGASGQIVIQSVQTSAVDPFPTLPASTRFSVTGCVTVPPPRPKLAANPAVFVDGTYTQVIGTGFAPGEPIELTWQTPAGVTLTACSPTADSAPPLVTDAHGDIDTACFAPPHQILGAARLVATQTTTQNAAAVTQQAAAPVVVEGGSMQPSSGSSELVFRR